jgi:DNA-binding transcriptional LysR family regulator
MTLDDLRIFNAVCEAQNLSAVARDLRCTQPAVSQHVTRLERELGVPLLDRSARGVVLTHAGQILYHASSAGLGALALAVREIHRLRAGEAGDLSISTGGTTVRHFMRDAVVRFRELHPEVTLQFEPASSTPRCLEAVARRRADLAFITISGDLSGFELRPVLEQPLMLLVRADHPLAARRQVRIQDLRTISYISMSESTVHHGLIRERVATEGVTLEPTARVDDFDTANVFVELGLGEAIVPAVQGRDFERGGRVRALPIRGLPPIPVGWAARRFKLLSPAALEFMEVLADTAKQWRDIPGVKLIRS